MSWPRKDFATALGVVPAPIYSREARVKAIFGRTGSFGALWPIQLGVAGATYYDVRPVIPLAMKASLAADLAARSSWLKG